MKVLVERDAALNALITLKHALSTTSQELVTVVANNTSLVFSIMGNQCGMTITLNADVQEQGIAALSLFLLVNFLAHLTPGIVQVSTQDSHCIIQNEASASDIACYRGKHALVAPPSHDTGMYTLFTMHTHQFCDILHAISFAAEKEGQGQHYLQCILIQPSGTYGLHFVASDAHCMAHYEVSLPHTMHEQILIPASTLMSFVDAIRHQDTHVSCAITPEHNIVLFTDETFEGIIKPQQGFYPPFHALYAPSYTVNVTVQVPALQHAISIASLHDTQHTIFTLESSLLTVSSPVTKKGQSSTRIHAVTQGQSPPIVLPTAYIQAILSHIQGPSIRISWNVTGLQRLVLFTSHDNHVRYSVVQVEV